MAKKLDAPDVPALIPVWPVQPTNPTEYVRIPEDGAEVTPEEATCLLAAGLVTTTPPDAEKE